jgi:NADH:ubiquinone oxidoreductase subunit 6 (subunit J)
MARPYQRKVYWNEPVMGWWERAYLFEILRGLFITGGIFLRNMGRWITGRKGALTTYYPEETRFDYAEHNRGKHILTQRPDGSPQCIACNMCATVCPAQVIEIAARRRRHAGRPRMIDSFLQNLDTLLLYVFGVSALVAAALMIVLRHPMQVAMALISTMVFLGGIYGLLGVHFIAAFQVLIYVSAVMVFMVYVIMLLDVRDASLVNRFSRLMLPGLVTAALLVAVLLYGVWRGHYVVSGATVSFGLQQFSAAFLNEYWLHFELTSVLLLAAVVAAIAVIKGGRKKHG